MLWLPHMLLKLLQIFFRLHLFTYTDRNEKDSCNNTFPIVHDAEFIPMLSKIYNLSFSVLCIFIF